MKVSTKFEIDTTIRLSSYSVIAADTLRDLVTLTFDLLTGQLSYMAGHVINPSTKFEDPMAIRC